MSQSSHRGGASLQASDDVERTAIQGDPPGPARILEGEDDPGLRFDNFQTVAGAAIGVSDV